MDSRIFYQTSAAIVGGNHAEHFIRENLNSIVNKRRTARINFIPQFSSMLLLLLLFHETTNRARPPIYRMNLPQSCRTFSKFSSILSSLSSSSSILQRSQTFPFNQSTELLNKYTISNSRSFVYTHTHFFSC